MIKEIIAEYRWQLAQVDSAPRRLRQFALILSIAWVIIFLFKTSRWEDTEFWFWLVWPPAVTLLLAHRRPALLVGPYRFWLSLAFILGAVVSRLLLTLLFFLVLTPVRLLARLCGRHFLSRRFDRQAKSYWQNRDSEGSMEQPF